MKMQCYIFVGEHYFPASSASKCLWILVKEVSLSLMRQGLFGNHVGGNGNIVLVFQAKKEDSDTALRNLLLPAKGNKTEQGKTWKQITKPNHVLEHGSSNRACPCLCYAWQYKGRAFPTRQERDLFQASFMSAIKLLRTWSTEMLDSKLSMCEASDAA